MIPVRRNLSYFSSRCCLTLKHTACLSFEVIPSFFLILPKLVLSVEPLQMICVKRSVLIDRLYHLISFTFFCPPPNSWNIIAMIFPPFDFACLSSFPLTGVTQGPPSSFLTFGFKFPAISPTSVSFALNQNSEIVPPL